MGRAAAGRGAAAERVGQSKSSRVGLRGRNRAARHARRRRRLALVGTASLPQDVVVGVALRTGRMETIDGKDDPLHYGAASPDVFGRTIHCAREAAASITAALAAVPPPAAARAVAFFVISDNEAVKSRTLALLPNSRALGCAGVPFWKAHDRADMECILSDWCEAVAT